MSLSHHVLFDCLAADLAQHIDISGYDFRSIQKVPVWSDMTFEQYASLSLAKSLLKKFKDGFSAGEADTVARNKFLLTNLRCKEWSADQWNTSADEELIGMFKQHIYDFYYRDGPLVPDSTSIVDAGRTGPGASIGALGTDFYTKLFASPLTCTNSGVQLVYERGIQGSERWALAERLRRSKFGEPTIVPGNKLHFVPKNVDTSRVIAVEPNLNMFLQLGIGGLITKRLKRVFGIDLENQQDINRDLAQIGSKFDSLSTIDLESASDSVSYKMVESLFPRDFVSWLKLCRSPVTSDQGRTQELYMLSSMGNGYTFPLQTLIFCCVVSAAYASMNLKLKRSQGEHLGNFGVFGDDIIIVKEAYRRVSRLLDLLGFTVNADKSFKEGPFRESCGGDFYRGRSCRGVYVKSLRSQPSRCVAINRLNHWSAQTGIALRATVGYIVSRTRFLPVPLYENDDAGIKVPFAMVSDLRLDKDVQSVLYRKHEPVTAFLRITEGAIKVPKGARSRWLNPEGLLTAFLRGDIVSDRIGIRLGPARYKTKQAISPGWDWLPTARRGLLVDELRLISAITTNMC